MPSGAKKRKAAKKKKEKGSTDHIDPSSASTHSHGDDDVKHQEDKDSDAGDLSSPASQDHHSGQKSLTEGEEEEIEKEKNISTLDSVKGLENENREEPSIVIEDDCVVQVEREFEIEDKSDKKNASIELDEPPRKSYDGGSSESSGSSSSSSSDDESRGIENSQSIVDIAPVVDSSNAADSLSGRFAETFLNAGIEEVGDSIVVNFPVEDLEKISSTSKKEVDMSSPADYPVACYAVDSVFEENGEKKQSSLEDEVGISAVITDASSERQEGESIVKSVETIVTFSDPKECISQENDDRLTPSHSMPRVYADSGITEPLLVPAPRPVQMTSWKSCCGLFEVLAGSGR